MNHFRQKKNKVVCPYKDNCSSYPKKCGRCIYNKNNKPDHFQPVPEDIKKERLNW